MSQPLHSRISSGICSSKWIWIHSPPSVCHNYNLITLWNKNNSDMQPELGLFGGMKTSGRSTEDAGKKMSLDVRLQDLCVKALRKRGLKSLNLVWDFKPGTLLSALASDISSIQYPTLSSSSSPNPNLSSLISFLALSPMQGILVQICWSHCLAPFHLILSSVPFPALSQATFHLFPSLERVAIGASLSS